MTDETNTVYVDCDAGRRLGCKTFCCRLLVKLKPHEMEKRDDGLPAKGYVGKDTNGLCVHMDSETWLCKIWEDRPETCREYSCNTDFLLQVAIREGFTNIVDLARKASVSYIPKETYIKVPLIQEETPAVVELADAE
ncbi:MAG: YkgJ family cysteine cluster protein [Gammaproteobacteria bacterium]|nr:YkgJ family cysteine cluster protein [Gammaproteobacteria bacterium]